MEFLEIVQKFCRRTGLPVPDEVFDSNDDQLLQIAELANEIVEDLIERRSWTVLQYSTTFTSVAGSDQGAIDTLAPNALWKIQNNVIWDRTTRLKVFGPLDPQEWQQLKALEVAGPLYRYRIEGGRLLFFPDMEAGHTMAFDYVSAGAVMCQNSVQVKRQFENDKDTFRLPYNLLLKGLRWKWKEEKGLPYAEDFKGYERAVASYASGDGTKRAISLAGGNDSITPGIWVPAGSWPISQQ